MKFTTFVTSKDDIIACAAAPNLEEVLIEPRELGREGRVSVSEAEELAREAATPRGNQREPLDLRERFRTRVDGGQFGSGSGSDGLAELAKEEDGVLRGGERCGVHGDSGRQRREREGPVLLQLEVEGP